MRNAAVREGEWEGRVSAAKTGGKGEQDRNTPSAGCRLSHFLEELEEVIAIDRSV